MADHTSLDPQSDDPTDRAVETPGSVAENVGSSAGLPRHHEHTPRTSSGQPAAKPRRSSILSVSVLVLAIGLVVNWPFQYIEVNSGTSGSVNSQVDFPPSFSELPVMAGWPYCYLISYSDSTVGAYSDSTVGAYSDSTVGDGAVVQWSATALLYNVVLLLGILAAVALYTFRRDRWVAGSGKSANRRVTIADLLLLTVFLSITFAGWQRLSVRAANELELAAHITREGGRSIISAWAPRIVASHLPTAIVNRLRRIRAVRIEHPPTELVQKLVEQPELTLLRIGGGDYDLRLLEQLAGNPHLHDLRVSGRAIDGRTIQWIASNRRLDTLNLMRTNVSAEALRSLDSLPRLQRLNLVHSDVDLNELGSPTWSATVREMVLPHPQPGDTATLEIKGWPGLSMLSINDMESQTNAAVMSVTLADLPSLTTLKLDVFQKFDLNLRNLPRLKEIAALDYEWMRRIPRGGVAPGHLWLSRLDAEGLPEFENLNFFGVDLEYFRVQQAPKFRFVGLGAFYKTVSASTYARELSSQAASAAIEGIGRSDGPTSVDLDAVPLKGVDLSPLAENRRLERIMLSQSGTSIEEWKGLSPMNWLKRLDVKDCPINDNGLRWVLDSFPQLEHLALTPGYVDANTLLFGQELGLEIIDRPALTTIDLGDSRDQFWTRVRIINSPNVSLPLRLSYVENLELVGAASITGIAVSGPLPAETKLSGLRDLSFFAVGGPDVTDAVIEPLAECNELTTLTLAYPGVTAAGLKKLSGLEHLTSLHLPGSALNDSVIESWGPLPKLSSLDIRDTEVTGEGLKLLLAGRLVSQLRLSGSKIEASELSILTEMMSVSELMIAGIGIDANTLRELLSSAELSRIDLSDTKITDEAIDALIDLGGSIGHLAFRNCEINEQKLALLANKFKHIRFDLSGSSISSKLMARFLSAQRLMNAQEWKEHLQMQAFRDIAYNQTYMGVGELEAPQESAMIDVDYFADLRDQPSVGSSGPPGPINRAFTSPVPLGTQLGRWLGGVVAGNSAVPATDEADPSTAVDTGDSPPDGAEDESVEEDAESSADILRTLNERSDSTGLPGPASGTDGASEVPRP